MKNKTITEHDTVTQPTPQEFWVIGRNYFIRTVTYHYTGKLLSINEKEITLGGAAWIADSGRFQQAVATCSFDEVELFPIGRSVLIGRGAIVDAVELQTIPTSQS
jgi:hypothetical protein